MQRCEGGVPRGSFGAASGSESALPAACGPSPPKLEAKGSGAPSPIPEASALLLHKVTGKNPHQFHAEKNEGFERQGEV